MKSRALIFLAEDDPELRQLLMAGLEQVGFEVLAAGSGREILDLLTAASRGELRVPDAIVMDVRMPGCSGIDVLGALRLASWEQPIVMITGFGDLPVHTRAADRGASIVLDKPFGIEDLVAVLDMLLLFSASAEDDAPSTVRCPTLSPPNEVRHSTFPPLRSSG